MTWHGEVTSVYASLTPATWRSAATLARKLPDEKLRLQELIILKRLRRGESPTDIAESLHWPRTQVNSALQVLRKRFNVKSSVALLDLDVVIQQLDADEREECEE